MRHFNMTAVFAAALLAGCAGAPKSGPALLTPPKGDAGAWWDCVREAGGLVSAHRAGGAGALPENSLAALKATAAQIPAVLEVDVIASADGVLFLHHDRTLERTTTGAGPVAARTWSEIKSLKLKDRGGEVTREHPTRIEKALAWARGRSILFLDLKPQRDTADPAQTYRDFARALIGAVRAASAERNVVLIAYTEAQALTLHALAPDLMLSVGVSSMDHLDRLVAQGVDLSRVIAWTGVGHANLSLWEELSARGVEVNFGTLGEPGQRLDDRFAADGDPSEYHDLIDQGVDVIASATPFIAADAITADEAAVRQCAGR